MSINRVVLTGNLTRDPELRATGAGTPVCRLRVACNTRRKNSDGMWEDKPNFFDVTVWGAHGEACARHLAKGRPIAVDGRLEWQEWVDQTGARRQAVHIVASVVQFLAGCRDGDLAASTPAATADAAPAAAQDQILPAPASAASPVNAIVGPDVPDDDIPF